MSEPTDGPWDGATEHDDSLARDHGADDDSGARASVAERVRARAAARASAPAMRGSSTLPPPVPDRAPAKSVAPANKPTAPAVHAPLAAPPAPLKPGPSASEADDVVLLQAVRTQASTSAPSRDDTAAGGVAIVAAGTDAERMRRLCHGAGLLVPVLASMGAVHDAASVVVIGEPSPPIPSRISHVLRPVLPDEVIVQLLHGLASGRAVAEPPAIPDAADPRAADLAAHIATLTERRAIETACIEAITILTGADRAQLLFHDPATGALYSETKRRTGTDERRAVAGMVGWCAITGHAVHASPAGDDPRYLTEIDDPEGKAQSRLLVQPIIGGDRRVHAVLVAARRWRKNDFSEVEQTALRALAARIATTVDLAASGGIGREPRAQRSTLPGVTSNASSAGTGSPSDAGSTTSTAPTTEGASKIEAGSSAGSPPDARVIVKPRSSSEPRAAEKRASSEPAASDSLRSKPPSEPPPSASSSLRSKRRSSDGSEPLDVAVVATDEMLAGHVKKLARKARVEVSVLCSAADAPPYYRVLTIGQAWTPETDARVVYAARDTITDEQLTELLVGLTTDRAPAPLVAEPPQTAAEAKRLTVAFTRVRGLATATGLAELETLASTAVREMLDADHAYCLFYAGSDGGLWSEIRRRARGDDRKAIAGIVGWSARTGLPANVPRSSADPRWLQPLDDPEGDPNGQLITQPIIDANRRVIGVLVAARRPRRAPFSESDAVLLSRYAALASPFIDQLRLAAATHGVLNAATEPGDDELRAVQSPVQALMATIRTAPRWSWALSGALVGAALVKLAGC